MELNKKEMILIIGCVFIIGLCVGSYWMKQSSIDTIDYIGSTYKELNKNIDEMDAHHHSYEKCLNDIDDNKKEDIAMNFVKNDISECWIMNNNSLVKQIKQCDVHIGAWGNSEIEFYTIEIQENSD